MARPERAAGGYAAVAATVLALFWVSLAAWAFASPTGSSPDDDYHLARVYCATGDYECTPEGLRQVPCFAWMPKVTGDCTPAARIANVPGIRHEPMDDLAAPALTGIHDDRPEVIEAVLSRLVGDTLAQTTMRIRLLNVTLAVAIAGLSVLLTRAAWRPAVALSWLVAAVPLGMFVVSSINPSAWAIVGVVGLWGPLLTLVTGKRWDRSAAARLVFVQLVVVMAIGARTDAPVYVSIVALTAAVYAWQAAGRADRALMLRLAVPAALVAQSVAVFAFVSMGRASYIASGLAVQRNRPTAAAGPEGPGVVYRSLSGVLDAVAAPMLGWMDTAMPSLVAALATGALFAAAVVGAGAMDRPKATAVGVFLTLTGAFLVLVSSRVPSTQPRYFLPLLMVASGLLLLPPRRGRARVLSRAQVALVLLGLVGANALALLVVIQRFSHGAQSAVPRPGDLAAAPAPGWWWSALPAGPFDLWLVGSAAFAAACWSLWLLLPWLARAVPAPARAVGSGANTS